MKHNKGQCLIFVESRLPCEDCDLEGHSPTCGWHKDWHDCSCGALDKEGIKMSIYSYNAGYHRGLNTEYHNVPIEILYKQWADGVDILLIPVSFDPVAFEKGYADGVRDYLKNRNCVED
jgi:hypothetical protein